MFLELSADKQGESSDSGYDYSQQSELESSENIVVLEMEDDPMSISQAALDDQLKVSEMNGPIPLSGDLEGKLYFCTWTYMYNRTVVMWNANCVAMITSYDNYCYQ